MIWVIPIVALFFIGFWFGRAFEFNSIWRRLTPHQRLVVRCWLEPSANWFDERVALTRRTLMSKLGLSGSAIRVAVQQEWEEVNHDAG